MDDLGANAVANVFDMLVTRISNVEESIAWMARTNAVMAPAGTKIPGTLFDVPFDIYKCYGTESPTRLHVVFEPRDPKSFAEALARPAPASQWPMHFHEEHWVLFLEQGTSFAGAITCVLRFLEWRRIAPETLDQIYVDHTERPEIHELYRAAYNSAWSWEMRQEMLRRQVEVICWNKARAEDIRREIRDLYRLERTRNLSERVYDMIWAAFADKLDGVRYG